MTLSYVAGLLNICAGVLLVASILSFVTGYIIYLVYNPGPRRDGGLYIMYLGVVIMFVLVVIMGIVNFLLYAAAVGAAVIAIIMALIAGFTIFSRGGGGGAEAPKK